MVPCVSAARAEGCVGGGSRAAALAREFEAGAWWALGEGVMPLAHLFGGRARTRGAVHSARMRPCDLPEAWPLAWHACLSLHLPHADLVVHCDRVAERAVRQYTLRQ